VPKKPTLRSSSFASFFLIFKNPVFLTTPKISKKNILRNYPRESYNPEKKKQTLKKAGWKNIIQKGGPTI